MTDNPLLTNDRLPPFAAIQPEHVAPAVAELLANCEAEFRKVEATLEPTWAGSMARLESLDHPFERGWKPVGHLMGVKNSSELRAAYEATLPSVVEFGLKLRQSEPLYRTLKAIQSSPAFSQLEESQRRIIADRVKDAELAGIALTGAARERFNAIEKELSQIATTFANNVLDATKAFSLEMTAASDVEGMPSTARSLASSAWNAAHPEEAAKRPATAEAGPWRFTLDTPSYSPLMEHCRRRDHRETMYRAFVGRASSGERDNGPLITQILQLRAEKAKLLGFRSFAELSLARKMAPSVDAVREMLERLRQASWESAGRDLEDLRQLKKSSGDETPLELWDVPFWAERLREQRYAYTDEELRPYFAFENVLAGLFGLIERLFGATIRDATEGTSVWHDDVRFYRMYDEAGREIAGFYLDPYSRPENKRGGAWMDDCLGRRREGDQFQLPVAHLVCNQTPPADGKPSLMTFREVETLFHEFGHGLQHMLTRVAYAEAAGINGVEWDAVELPSQFLENWCYHRPTLMGMARHYITGEPLPDALFEKLKAAKTYRAGSMMLRQLQFGLVDLALHHEFDPHGATTVHEVARKIAATTSVLPPLPEERSLCSFSHIFAGGYAAGYYSYKWAEVLSADAFSAFEEAGLDDEAAVVALGRKFRDTVLALGGGRHPMDVYRDFRGRAPTVDALLRHSGLA